MNKWTYVYWKIGSMEFKDMERHKKNNQGKKYILINIQFGVHSTKNLE